MPQHEPIEDSELDEHIVMGTPPRGEIDPPADTHEQGGD
jgi:hypothetical protein